MSTYTMTGLALVSDKRPKNMPFPGAPGTPPLEAASSTALPPLDPSVPLVDAPPYALGAPVHASAADEQQVANGHVGHEGHCAIPVQMDAAAGSTPIGGAAKPVNDEEAMPQQEANGQGGGATVRHYYYLFYLAICLSRNCENSAVVFYCSSFNLLLPTFIINNLLICIHISAGE